MHHWHLCARGATLHTGLMRLPQSSSLPLSLRVFLNIIPITLAVMVPLRAQSVAQQLILSPNHLKFGNIAVGRSEIQPAVLTNTGNTSATVSAIGTSNSEFSVSGLSLPMVLAAGQSVALNATFTPTTVGWTSDKAKITSNASNPSIQLGLAGTGVSTQALTAAPSSLSFGKMAVGTSATLSVVLTNTRSTKETLQAFQLVGSGFSVSGPVLPVSLSPGKSVTVGITYAPQAAGPMAGSLFISGPALNVPLAGTGTTIGLLTIAPTALNFGNVMVGETGTQTAVLNATGGSVTISSAASSNSQFVLPGASFPLTIAAGQSAQINVVFTPQKAGTASANLSFASNASNPQATEPVAGTGTSPQVSLGWNPSTSQVQGYNVYRGTSPGTYSKINSTVDPNTSYTDTTVAPGVTYYYAATAVGSTGEESTYSAPVMIAVP